MGEYTLIKIEIVPNNNVDAIKLREKIHELLRNNDTNKECHSIRSWVEKRKMQTYIQNIKDMYMNVRPKKKTE